MDKIISCININKTYDGLKVLKGINLEIRSGEIVAIVGPSGAGKTTLLQIMGTLDEPDKVDNSSLIIDSIDVKRMNQSSFASFRNQNLGFIFQFHELLPEFTALENVCIPGWIGKRKQKELKQSAGELLALIGLSDRLNHKPQELSGGEQQRVAIARAFACEAEVLFCDEPTGNLDSSNSDLIAELIFDSFKESSSALIIVTHDIALANKCDQKIELIDGKIL